MIPVSVKEGISGFEEIWEYIDYIEENETFDVSVKKSILAEAVKVVTDADDWSSVIGCAITFLDDFDLATTFLDLSLRHIDTIGALDELSGGLEFIEYDEDDPEQSRWFNVAFEKIERKNKDPHVAILSNLLKSYKYNQRVYTDRFLKGETKPVHLPTIPGPTGVGKTALVRKFAKKMKFECITLEGGELTAGHLLMTLQIGKDNIMQKVTRGVVVLIERFNQLSLECQNILKQYENGDIDVVGKVAKSEGKIQAEEHRFQVKPITELFIIGEITT